MFLKIATLAFAAFVVITAEAAVWNGFTASWSLNTSTHFYDLPKTLKAAQNAGWTRISGVNEPHGVTPLGYYGDPEFVILFKKNTAIGIQIAFPVSEVDPKQPLKWDDLDVITKKNLNGNELYYTATAYFYDNKSTGERKIWLQEKNGLREVPTNTSELLQNTPFLKKSCIPTMGTHYYAWTQTSDCATLIPWVILADETDVIGILLQGFGKISNKGTRTWWETIPPGGINVAIPDPPPCAVNAVGTFDTISLHVWFVDKPQSIICN